MRKGPGHIWTVWSARSSSATRWTQGHEGNCFVEVEISGLKAPNHVIYLDPLCGWNKCRFQLWLKFRPSPLENAVMKNKRRGSAKMPSIRMRVNHDFPIYVLDPFEFYLNGSYSMFVGPDFRGHHFIACDAHDTWEGKHVFIPNLKPRPFKNLISRHSKPM